MAETEAAGAGFDFLKTKVGPLPLVVWMGAGLAIWLVLQRKQSTGSSSGSPTGATAGQIDPATGYSYGTSQDQLALANLASGSLSSGSSSTGTSGTTTAGTYATNQAWSEAALNYLVAQGNDPTVATQAIQQYLSSQSLTTQQQGMVNLVIQALGAPPQLPGASATNPTPVGGGTTGAATNATNPPTGVAAGNITATAISLKWNQAANATGYTVSYGVAPNTDTDTTSTGLQNDSVAGTDNAQNGVTIGNLLPATTYAFKVQATPASSGAGWSEPITVTTSKS